MDKELLDALNNLASALEYLSDSLDKNKSSKKTDDGAAVSKAFAKGDGLNKMLSNIKEIKADTTKLLKQQNILLELNKSKKTDKSKDVDTVSKLGKDKKAGKNFKDGVGVILAIAGAVLAIGLAFKIIGSVDFLSVISLAISLPLLAYAFSKVLTTVKKVGYDPKKDSTYIILAMTSMSLSIAMSSWILRLVTPIGFGQAVTAILIAGMFTVLSFGLGKILKALKDIKIESINRTIVYLPMVMLSMSTAIAVSSWVLGTVKTIGFGQAITAILIAGMFTVLSFGLAKILVGLDKLKAKDIYKIPFLAIIFPAMALAISLSSYFLQGVVPLGLGKAITAILIAGMFTVLSFGLAKILVALNKAETKNIVGKVILLPIIFPAMALAISLSSLILQGVQPISFSQFLTSIGISLLFLAMTPTIVLINKFLGDNIKKMVSEVFFLPIIFTALSAAILASSFILAQSVVVPLNILLQSAVIGLTLSLTLAVVAAGIFIVKKTGITMKDLLFGCAGMAVIAGAIALSSLLLSIGNYSNYPSLQWALGVGVSMLLFVPPVVLLGTIVAASVGTGAIIIAAGALAMVIIAGAIVAVDAVLANGKYSNYPSLQWALGVGTSLILFVPAIVALGTLMVGTLGIGYLAVLAGISVMKTLAQSIVDVDTIVSKGRYNNYPSHEWALGVGGAITAFAPVIKAMEGEGIVGLIRGGIDVDTLKKGIIAVSEGIMIAADFFSTHRGSFLNPPSVEWANGVGKAINAFAPVFDLFSHQKWYESNQDIIDKMKYGVSALCYAIIDASNIFSQNKASFSSYPSNEWGTGVANAIKAFTPIFDIINGTKWYQSSFGRINDLIMGVSNISRAMAYAANIFSGASWGNYPSKIWAVNVGEAINEYSQIASKLNDNSSIDFSIMDNSITSIGRTGKILNGINFNQVLNKQYMIDLGYVVDQYDAMVNRLSASAKSRSDLYGLSIMFDPVLNIAKGISALSDSLSRLANSMDSFNTSVGNFDINKTSAFIQTTHGLGLTPKPQIQQIPASANTTSKNSSEGGLFSKIGNAISGLFGGDSKSSTPSKTPSATAQQITPEITTDNSNASIMDMMQQQLDILEDIYMILKSK